MRGIIHDDFRNHKFPAEEGLEEISRQEQCGTHLDKLPTAGKIAEETLKQIREGM